MASRIAVMNQGEIQQFAAPDDVYNRPANLFVARFLGSPPMNTVPARLAADGDTLVAVDRRQGAAAAASATRRRPRLSSTATSSSASGPSASPIAGRPGHPARGARSR